MILNYCLFVTGPPYGTQNSSTAYQFANALLLRNHILSSIFFYHEGVLNANTLTSPASDEFNLVKSWEELSQKYNIILNVCISAALRRGIINLKQLQKQNFLLTNFKNSFNFVGLSALAEALITCDRVIQF
ncbi:Sulfurtransferase TusD [Serratia symbiotica]|nr:Sulfurtransferase TusD [Serratia symbiotica]